MGQPSIQFENTRCAICQTVGNSALVYKPNFSGETIDEQAFSARRFYDKKIHFRIVRCLSCGLLRSDPIASSRFIETLYEKSKFQYGEQTQNLNTTYGAYLLRTVPYAPSREALLDIGCGSGFFLEKALQLGFKNVYGVEPSEDAIHKASPHIQPHILHGFFNGNMYNQEKLFDVICMFQVLEHFLDPDKVIKDCFNVLKPGGCVLAINHDVHALVTRLLGKTSPVIDIEHMYFFDKKTTRLLFERNGFVVRDIFSVTNTHALGYLLSLIPLKPIWLKDALLGVAKKLHIDTLPIAIPIGNMGIIAQKPQGHGKS